MCKYKGDLFVHIAALLQATLHEWIIMKVAPREERNPRHRGVVSARFEMIIWGHRVHACQPCYSFSMDEYTSQERHGVADD